MKRKVTATEFLYLSIEKGVGAFSLLRVVKGTFVNRDEVMMDIQRAWDQATRQNPIFRLSLVGKHWVSLPESWVAPVQVVNNHIDLLKVPKIENLNLSIATIALWVFHDGFVFQVSHAITDGVGLQILIGDFFNLLNDRVVVVENSKKSAVPLNERHLAIKLKIKHRWFLPKLDQDYSGLNVTMGKYDEQLVRNHADWAQMQIPLNSIIGSTDTKTLLPTLMLRIARWLKKYNNQSKVRFMLPVDLRKYDDNTQTAGNYSLPLWFEIDGDEVPVDFANLLRGKIRNKEALSFADPLWLSLRPLVLLRNFVFLRLVKKSNQKKRYPVSVILTYLGKVKPEENQFVGFRAESIWSTALYSGIAPIQIHITHDEFNVQIHLSYNCRIFTITDVNALFDQLLIN
jgi:hypothetical protein